MSAQWLRGARGFRYGIVAAALMLLLGAAACGSQEPAELPEYFDVPAFTLTDQLGREFSSSSLEGKVMLANFVFINCTLLCPVLTPRMVEVQSLIGGDGLLGSRVVLLSITVDPEQDTPEALRAYADGYGADHESWRFLTGNPEDVRAVITDGLKLGYNRIDQSNRHVHTDGTVHLHEYNVLHSTRMVLADRAGVVRALYNTEDWDAERVVADIETLLQ